jgi:hypothetical protein
VRVSANRTRIEIREPSRERPTAAELSLHLKHALMWVEANPDAASARAILIYAWNENDESGWLVPTFGDGTWRLQATRKALRNDY